MKKTLHIICRLLCFVALGTGSAFADTEDSLIQEFEFYENIITERFSRKESKEAIQLEREAVLKNAKEIFASRFKLSIVGSPNGRKAKNGTLSKNFVRGIVYFNNSDGTVSPYGETMYVRFGNTSADFNISGIISGIPTFSTIYKQFTNKVVVASRFGEPLLSLPYPFSKHCFKATVEKGLGGCFGREVLMMNVPLFNNVVALNGRQMHNVLKGKKYIGFTEYDDIKITVRDKKFSPALFTVVEFSPDGHISITFPQLDRVEMLRWDYSFTQDGTVLWIYEPSSYNYEMFKKDFPVLPFTYYDKAAEVFKRLSKNKKSIMLGVVKNNGDVLDFMSTIAGAVYRIL